MDYPRFASGCDKQVPPEGRRGTLVVTGHGGMDHRSVFIGPDKHVPPRNRSEGHACRDRGITMDNPTSQSGPDKNVPPICECTDLTSRSLREIVRRGTLVVPAKSRSRCPAEIFSYCGRRPCLWRPGVTQYGDEALIWIAVFNHLSVWNPNAPPGTVRRKVWWLKSGGTLGESCFGGQIAR